MGIDLTYLMKSLVVSAALLSIGAEIQGSLPEVTDSADRKAIIALSKSLKIDPADIEVEAGPSLLPQGTAAPIVAHKKVLRIRVHKGQVQGLFLQKYKLSSTKDVTSLEHLRELHLINVGLTGIEGLESLPLLTALDLAGNDIKAMKGLQMLSTLESLVLYRNGIKTIEGLDELSNLRYLNINNNQIKTIGGLDALFSLEELYLGGNKIKKIEGLCALENLRVLSLHDNKIVMLENLGCLETLEQLHLSSNKIKAIQGLDGLPKLVGLYLDYNKIQKIEGLDGLGSLHSVDLSGNKIAEASEDLEILRSKSGSITSVVLHYNPLSKAERKALVQISPPGLVSLKPMDYKVTCKDPVDVPGGKSLDFYMTKAREFHDLGECGKACSYYYKAAEKHGPSPYNDTDKPEATNAAIAAAYCTMEVYKNAPGAIKQFLTDTLNHEQDALVQIGIAEALRRQGKLKQAVARYDDYLDSYPDGVHTKLAAFYSTGIHTFFQTNAIENAWYHVIKQPVQLIFFDLKTDEHGLRYL